MKKDLLKKYIEKSWMVDEESSFKISEDWNRVWFYDEDWDELIVLTIDELLESDIFIKSLSKTLEIPIMEIRFMHKNIVDVENFINNL